MTDILVVDDKVREGQSFRKLIEAETGLATVFTRDPAEAEEIVRSGQIKVAVLDQLLEGTTTSGTKLFRQLRKRDPDIRGLLFSGEAKSEDLIEALDEDFVSFLNKNNIAELPERVLSIYGEYLADIAQRVADSPPAKEVIKRRFSARGRTVRYDVLTVRPATGAGEEEIVREDRYVTVLKLNAGQEKELSVEAGRTTEVIMERESSTKLRLASAAEIKALTKLESAVESVVKVREARREQAHVKAGEREKYFLPADPAGGSTRSVRARHIERAPVYRRERAVVRVTCECCGIARLEPVNVLVPTGGFRERHHDYYSDNTDDYVNTG